MKNDEQIKMNADFKRLINIEEELHENNPLEKNKCCLCRKRELTEYNKNNPEPFGNDGGGSCCNLCNNVLVVPTRILQLNEKSKDYHKNYLEVLKNWVRLCLE